MIKTVAEIITGEVRESYFVGHVGGDDFVAVVDRLNAEAICCEFSKDSMSP